MKKPIDIVLDIETLGTDIPAVVTQISMVEFDRETGAVQRNLNKFVKIQDSLDLGCHVTEGTLRFWFDQPRETAIHVLFNELAEPIASVLESINGFINSLASLDDKTFDPKKDIRIWCMPDFDMAILKSLYVLTGIRPAFSYGSARCIRTECESAGLDRKSIEFVGTHHNAFDDCRNEALQLHEAYRLKRETKADR